MTFHSYMNVEGQSALKIEPWTANASQIALYAYPFQIVYCNTNPIFGQANGNVFRVPMNLAGQRPSIRGAFLTRDYSYFDPAMQTTIGR